MLFRSDASFIGSGTGQTAVAAVRRGEIDALVNVDPVISLLESENAIKVVADTRTLEGTRQVFGGTYPAAVLYTTPGYLRANAPTVQALTNAIVRALRWIASHSPEQIADVMPAEYALGDRANYVRSISNSMPMFSPDGKKLGMIRSPELVANLTFGDPDLKTLYVAARMGLYKMRVNVAGIPGK